MQLSKIHVFCLSLSNLSFANDMRWLFMGSKPVQSCNSVIVTYLWLLVMTRRAIFWINCSFWYAIIRVLLHLSKGHLSKGHLSKEIFIQGTLVQEDFGPRRHLFKDIQHTGLQFFKSFRAFFKKNYISIYI